MANGRRYPQAARENAVDRFLNQTLPQMIDARNDRLHKEEQMRREDAWRTKTWRQNQERIQMDKKRYGQIDVDKKTKNAGEYQTKITELFGKNNSDSVKQAKFWIGGVDENGVSRGYHKIYNELPENEKANYTSPEAFQEMLDEEELFIPKYQSNWASFTSPNATKDSRQADYDTAQGWFLEGKISKMELNNYQVFAQQRGMGIDFGVKKNSGMTTTQWAKNQGNADTHIFRYKKEYGDNPGSTKSATEANKPSSWLHFTRGVVDTDIIGDTQKKLQAQADKAAGPNQTASRISYDDAQKYLYRQWQAQGARAYLDKVIMQSQSSSLFEVSTENDKFRTFNKIAGLALATFPEFQGKTYPQIRSLMFSTNDAGEVSLTELGDQVMEIYRDTFGENVIKWWADNSGNPKLRPTLMW
mgnify:CR=1 FL=1